MPLDGAGRYYYTHAFGASFSPENEQRLQQLILDRYFSSIPDADAAITAARGGRGGYGRGGRGGRGGYGRGGAYTPQPNLAGQKAAEFVDFVVRELGECWQKIAQMSKEEREQLKAEMVSRIQQSTSAPATATATATATTPVLAPTSTPLPRTIEESVQQKPEEQKRVAIEEE
jgi:hypothetical protein